MMNVTCKDRERIFEDGTASEWEALELHAASCAQCAEEIAAWKSLSVAAKELQDYLPSPELWPRIERALAEQAASKAKPNGARNWFSFLPSFSLGWQTALAGACVLLLTVSLGWVYVHKATPPGEEDKSLLRSSALKEVESAEAAYEKAIDKLAAEAKPELDEPATPLLASYHEKLLVLDSAIEDLRAQAGLNPSNAQLRYQLLAMYREKEQTLQEVLEAKKQ
ncbi:MAG TPA: anti-sigma factor [Candidatus Acidoferrum sp.]|nr:anti-sigma factor [Candidatus Acidoferrum sp.]